MIISEKTAPVKGEKVSLKIQRTILHNRVIYRTRGFFYYSSNAILFPFSLDGFGFF